MRCRGNLLLAFPAATSGARDGIPWFHEAFEVQGAIRTAELIERHQTLNPEKPSARFTDMVSLRPDCSVHSVWPVFLISQA